MIIKQLLKIVTEVLFPSRCVHCGTSGELLCKDCFNQIDFLKYQFCPACKEASSGGYANHGCGKRTYIDQQISLCWYRGPIVSLIQKLKFPPYLKSISNVLTKIINLNLDQDDYMFWQNSIVVPVPLHRHRLNTRGYNQAQIIAEELIKNIHNGKTVELLIKTKDTNPQSSLTDVASRRKNITGGYQTVENDFNISTISKILLVDDVTTSGSTLQECAKTLKGKYPNVFISAITIAKG